MAVPAQTLYFAMYDTARDVLLGKGFGAYAAPALAGAGARVLASSMVAPLELLRTKAQAETMPPSMLSMAARELRSGGPLVFWRGLSPTLWRDVPFSAIYWSTVEWLKPRLARDFSPLGTSALSGAAGGLIAAALTHPFDVVKTRRQVLEFARDVSPSPEERRTFGVMRAIVRRDGLNGLFVGLLPRVTKIIPGTAIMLSTYDFSKSFFAARPN
jgi:solute carrier family 25 protein 39/40